MNGEKIPELIEYSRNQNNEPDGVLVARKTNLGNVLISWSAVHPLDRFEKKMALHIARERFCHFTSAKVPIRLRNMLPKFKERCQKYFKSDSFIVIGDLTVPACSSRIG